MVEIPTVNERLFSQWETLENLLFPLSTRIDPKLLLFSITGRCNSRCIMCNIWQEEVPYELTLSQISRMLDDPAFRSIENVTLTGGEPTLRADIGQIAKLLIKNCSNLRNIDVPSNGLQRELVISAAQDLHEACKGTNVRFNFAFSLDGIGAAHGKVRGIHNAFERTSGTIDAVSELRRALDFDIHVHSVVTKVNIAEEIVNFLLSDLKR